MAVALLASTCACVPDTVLLQAVILPASELKMKLAGALASPCRPRNRWSG